MIARTWRGLAAADRPQAYPAHFNAAVLPELRTVPGFIGAMLMRRDVEGGIEFQVTTLWESLAAIKAFAGEDHARAVVEPGAVAALVSFDDTVTHHEVLSGFRESGLPGFADKLRDQE